MKIVFTFQIVNLAKKNVLFLGDVSKLKMSVVLMDVKMTQVAVSFIIENIEKFKLVYFVFLFKNFLEN